jgi:predicted membrane-bound spermidine synthase
MGATLPVLAEILKPRVPQFNETVGRLYSVNALGSASASLITTLVLFGVFGLKAVTAFAAVCNCVTAWMVWTGSKSWRTEFNCVKPTQKEAVQPTAKSFGIAVVSMLALLTGLVTLSQEVLLVEAGNKSTLLDMTFV